MDSVDLLNKYKELNESYKPILVYHVGIDAGFFSEFNDLIFMIPKIRNYHPIHD